jgi:beta-1,4-N-acetylglucosaminyltransferase
MYALLGAIGLLVGLILLRFTYLASKCGKDATVPAKKRTSPGRTLIVLGSGGHTAEMLRLLGGMNLHNYTPRVYVVAEGDKMSVDKVEKFESTASNSTLGLTAAASIRKVPRARQVMQSYITSVFSTLVAVLYSLPIVWSAYPDLVLCNGPGTCIPVCFWAYVMKFFGLKNSKIIYIESVCRVEHLSLSGLLLYYLFMADCVFVQWPQLKQRYPRTLCIGRIV